MNANKHVLIDVICEDVSGSPFNGMRGICSQHQIDVLNKDAEKIGLTRRWIALHEYEKKLTSISNIHSNIGAIVGRVIRKITGETMEKNIATFAIMLGMFLLIGFFGIVLSFPTMLLWNGCLVPAISGIHLISWKQAWGILVLCSLLFKSTSTTSNKEK